MRRLKYNKDECNLWCVSYDTKQLYLLFNDYLSTPELYGYTLIPQAIRHKA